MKQRFDIKLGLEEIKEVNTLTTDEPNLPTEIETLKEETPLENSSETEEQINKVTEISIEEVSETSLVEMNDDIVENRRNDEELNIATDTIFTLESIAEVLSYSLKNESLQEVNSKLTNVALQSLYNKVKLVPNNFVSLENLKVTSSKLNITQLAIESIGEKIVSIFKTIVETLKRAIQWIQKFIRHFFNKFEAYKDNIKELRLSLIKDTKTDTSDKVFTNLSTIKHLKVNGNVNLSKDLSNFVTFLKSYFAHTTTDSKNYFDNINRIITTIATDENDIALKSIVDISPCSEMHTGKNSSYNSKNNNLESYISKNIILGEVQVIEFLPKILNLSVDDYNEAAKDSEFKLLQLEEAELTEVKVLSKDDLVKVLQSLEELCNISINCKKNYDSFISYKEQMVKELDKTIRSYTSSDSKSDDGKYIKTLSARMRFFDNIYISGSNEIIGHITKTLVAGITYANFCVKAYT